MSVPSRVAVVVMIGLLSRSAFAAEPAPVPTSSPVPAATPVPEPKSKTGNVDVFGRVLALDTASSTDGPSGKPSPWVGLMSLESVRAGAKYKTHALKAEVELEVRKGAALRNGYVDLTPGHGASLKGGYFKMPQSATELTSLWDLPLVHRGMINDVVYGKMRVGGRAAGAQAGWSSSSGWRPSIAAGAFQSLAYDLTGKLVPLPQKAATDFGMNVASRASLRPFGGPVEMGVFGEVRNSSVIIGRPPLRSWSSGVDLTLRDTSGWRAWAEADAGNDVFDSFNQVDRVEPVFTAGRLILAKRFGGRKKEAAFVEPYAMGEAIDPDRTVKWDVVWEGVLGINAGQWDRWKVQLQYETLQVATQTPHNLGPTPQQPDLLDRQAVLLQLGAAF